MDAFKAPEAAFAAAIEPHCGHMHCDAPIALAVSGGADSMALALLAQHTLALPRVQVFCVDHGLRHGSAAEARWTKAQLQARGFACEVLTLTPGDLPDGNLQQAARLGRYRAMHARCRALGIAVVCTAHTQDDQAETVLARLARGSGARGLSAMRVAAPLPTGPNHPSDVTLLRPVLTVRRAALREYLQRRGQRWLEDPSNKQRKYDRVRLREMLGVWEAAGFSVDRIAMTAENLQRSEAALEVYADDAQAALVQRASAGRQVMATLAFKGLPQDIQLRCLARCLQEVSGDVRSVRGAKLGAAVHRILANPRGQFTLHGCLLKFDDNEIVFQREMS
ncbi:MAG: tRNA lysidine(34) synthetase TilS [Pseudomonadota bacterium]